jgi:hypothetical protein
MPATATRLYAQRARDAHAAMLTRFQRPDGMLRRDGIVHRPGAAAHLWPLTRALMADLDVAGISGSAPDALNPVITQRMPALERYWDERGPAYASDPPGGRLAGRVGGDIYYDDNAWVGLALVTLQLRRPDLGHIDRAMRLAAFARSGWDDDPAGPSPGGVFWVQQARGIGARNHDRNAVSTAPNGQLILHLEALGALTGDERPSAQQMEAWVTGALTGPSGLIRDKIRGDIRGDDAIDEATWSYNQGSMIGLRALLARRDGSEDEAHAAAAQELATRAIDHYDLTAYAGEPGAFVAIFVRNLLVLYARTDDAQLRARISATLRERAEAAWARAGRRTTLLEHSSVVSLQALAAWDPSDYSLIA